MTDPQLTQIREFAQKYYQETDQFHNWNHILLVEKAGLELTQDFPEANKQVIQAAAYLHDIGRVIQDEGHPYESTKIAEPFLKKIKISEQEKKLILEAVWHHGKEDILQAKSLEAKILFDADKLQIVTIFGFLRCVFWLINERKMEMNKAMKFLDEYVQDVGKNFLQTDKARAIYREQKPQLESMIASFFSWQE